MIFSIKTFTAIALFCSTFVEAAPIDGLTKRAPKVLGLDFDVIKKSHHNSTQKRSGEYNSPLTNEGYYYITYLEFGTDHQKIGVDIDTGSADLWVPNTSANSDVQEYGVYDPSGSSDYQDTGEAFSIKYGDASESTGSTGEFVTDLVSLADGSAALKNFQFASVSDTSVDQSGILGIGLTSLEAPVYQGGGSEYPNFPVALKNAGYIDKVAYSLSLNSKEATTGSLLFGGKDTAQYEGDLVVLQHSGETARLDATLNSVDVAGTTIQVSTPYNFDSGTTITILDENTYNSLTSALGATGQVVNGEPIITTTTGSITYNFDGISIDVPISEIITDTPYGSALQVQYSDTAILGDNFLRYTYLVFDLEESTISIGRPTYSSESNIVPI
ncbi:candidapepsin-8 [[Candida] anglica]|uniref:candidapepsin n=1 Tax=[Candida] anglica TaxID=148631 RepID=A0ABP0E6R2_9ASCO